MESITAAVAAFTLGEPVEEPQPLAEAWSNEVYRAHTGTGCYALKILSPATAAGVGHAIGIEAAVLATGAVPMAIPVADRNAEWLTRLPDGRFARCHHWLSGTPASGVTPTAPYVRDVGRSLGVIHGLARPDGDTGQLAPVDLRRWHQAIRESAGYEWNKRLRALTQLVERAAADLSLLRNARHPMISSHRDLDPKNAVVGADGRVGLLDWDYAGPVVPGGELVESATSFCGDNPTLIAEFVQAYRTAGGPVDRIDPLDTAVQRADIDWLLRNVERCDSADPAEREIGRRLTPELIDQHHPGIAHLDHWATHINTLLAD
jgi:Ser/Thr protein kinase RdoA (MazF antagonist)